MSFAIITDTSANLPTNVLREKNIEVIPFSYSYGGMTFKCTDTDLFDGNGFYSDIKAGTVVTTSMISPNDYSDTMIRYLNDGLDVLYIGMSSGISSSFQASFVASRKLRELYPSRQIITIDTKGASLGEGLPVLFAAELREEGKSIEKTAEKVESLCKRMYQIFMVDDLMHLKRTGRCSNAGAIVGTMFQLKPILKGNESGKIVNIDKIRGRKRALIHLAEKYESLVVDPREQTVGIAHAGCEEDAGFLADLIRSKATPKSIMTVMYEPVTGSHVGPGTVALFFLGDENVRSK